MRPGLATPLTGWLMAPTEPGAFEHPDPLAGGALRWLPARAPGTVASALSAAGEWALGDARSLDAHDWWFRCSFPCADPARQGACRLEFAGLATVADVWLNGHHLLRSGSMFHEHSVDVSGLLRATNELRIRFASLAALLAVKRPRPRFHTALVDDQQLRWFRTALVGRIPGWAPRAEAVGPWRPVVLHEREPLTLDRADLRASVEGADGVVRVELRALAGRAPRARHAAGRRRAGQPRPRRPGRPRLRAPRRAACAPRRPLVAPHPRGQPLYPASVHALVDGAEVEVSLGPVGFRTAEVRTEGGAFELLVNGAPIFCRGACWTPLDVARLGADPAAYDEALDAAVDAGMNMLRVPGATHYEHDAFHDGCDRRGLLVWQDFMFANLDYPAEDPDFCASVEREATQLLTRLQSSPSLVILCGNSEVAQQAAMLGAPQALWTSAIFEKLLPAVARSLRPDAHYLPSTPWGGALPFHVGTGVSHYYGVGAYLRPLDDARRAGVRFTAECLAFSNIPDDRTIALALGPRQSPCVHPAWKARVPRDAGAGWDFEDVRDHYLATLFGVDPALTRRDDMERYLALGRVVTGEVMASALAEWRSAGSPCRGALIWFLRDLWPGAGWGLIDATGAPKAAYYFVKRAMQPVALLVTDEGLDGLNFHAINDTEETIDGDIELSVYQHAETLVASGSRPVSIAPRGALVENSDAILGHFIDITSAYRFGAHGRDVVVASLRRRGAAAPLATAFHFPLGRAFPRERALGLSASARPAALGGYDLTVRTRLFAQAIAIDIPGYRPDDNHFHLAPDGERTVRLRPLGPPRPPAGTVQALNGAAPARITLFAPEEAAPGLPPRAPRRG